MRRLLPVLFLLALLTACAAPPAPPATPEKPRPAVPAVPPSATALPSPTAPPSATPSPSPAPSTTPSVTPLPACVTLVYEGYAQFEIFAPTGERVLVDVYDPARLTRPAETADILLTTHTHWDHVNDEFVSAFPGAQIFAREGELQTEAVHILGIPSAHNAGEALKPEGGSNYLYRIDIGGLRIVHFGDIGQDSLTEAQLAALGRVDIAITQINNPYSKMNAENGKGVRLMEQVNPRLVIPTHLNLDTVKLAVAHWPPGFYAPEPALKICAADLGESTQFLLMGDSVATMRKYVDLDEWGLKIDG